MLIEDGPCPLLEGPEQDEGLDPETKKQKIHQPTLVNTLYARVLVATAVSNWMYSFETEFECYLSEPVIERSDMPLQWWQKNETRFKTLAHLANKFLCLHHPLCLVKGCSVKWACFMKPRGADSGRHHGRYSWTGHHAHQLCFRYYNLRLLNFEY